MFEAICDGRLPRKMLDAGTVLSCKRSSWTCLEKLDKVSAYASHVLLQKLVPFRLWHVTSVQVMK